MAGPTGARMPQEGSRLKRSEAILRTSRLSGMKPFHGTPVAGLIKLRA